MNKVLILLVGVAFLGSCTIKDSKIEVRDINSHFGADLYKIEQLVKHVDQNKELVQIKSDSAFGDATVKITKYVSKNGQIAKIEEVVSGTYINERYLAYYPNEKNLAAYVHSVSTQLMCDEKMNACYKEYHNYYTNADYYLKKYGSNLLTSKYKNVTYVPVEKPNFEDIKFITNPNDAVSIMEKDKKKIKEIFENLLGK